MSASNRPEPGVWQQFRRRRVTRTVVMYLSAAFAVMEAVWYFSPGVGLGEQVTRVVMGVVVLGFPLAVVLAWTYDLTPQGIVRTPDDAFPEPPEASSQTASRGGWLLLSAVAVVAGLAFRALRL